MADPLPGVIPNEPNIGPNVGEDMDYLQNYLRANYEIDRISKEFTDCFSQIIDDSIAFRNNNNMGLEYSKKRHGIKVDVETLEKIMGDPISIINQKIKVIQSLTGKINQIITNYKYNQIYTFTLTNTIENINIINNQLNDNAFIESLYQPLDIFRNPPPPQFTGVPDNNPFNQGLLIQEGLINTHTILILLKSAESGRYNVNIDFPIFIKQLFIELIGVFMTDHALPTGDIRNSYYLNLIPTIITNLGSPFGLIIKPDFRFFIRFFNCFVNFLRQLVAINFNVGAQLGGKKNKKTRRRIVKKGRKSKGRFRK